MNPKQARIVAAWLVAFALALGWAGRAKAQPTTHYQVGACFDRSFDVWTIDTCFFVIFDGSSGAVDSGIVIAVDTARYEGRTDSLCFTVGVLSSQIDATRNPWGIFVVDLSDGRRFRERVDLTHLVHAVDTARSANVSVTLDTADINQIIAAINAGLGGSGDFPETLIVVDTAQDALIQGARVFVYQVDTTCCQNGSGGQLTDLTGRVIYSIDSGTFPIAASASGYFQQSAYQLVSQASPGGLDTLKLYSFTPSVATGADSCNLIIYTDVPYSRAEISMHGAGQGMEAKPVRDTSGVWLDRGRIIPNPLADANGIIVVPVARYNATVPKAVYDIKILNERGHDLATFDNYKIPDSASHVLRVTP